MIGSIIKNYGYDNGRVGGGINKVNIILNFGYELWERKGESIDPRVLIYE